jgi:hypothetical protein
VSPARTPTTRKGFTIVEAAISAIVLGLLAAATLNTVSSAAASRRVTADRSRARLLADDLIGELNPLAYADPSNEAAALGPDALETNGASRVLFDDVDDYHGLTESPPMETDGKVIPGLTGWTRETRVQWASPASPTTNAAFETTVKRITVTVRRGNRVLARSETLRSGAWIKAGRTNKSGNASTVEASVTPK